MTSLSEELRIYEELKARLKAQYADIDEETLADSLEGETSLIERITSICRAAKWAEAQAKAAKGIKADISAREARYAAKAEHLRALALWAMQEAGIPKIPAPDMTISTSKGEKSVVITDLEKIPPHLCHFNPVADKKAIREELEAGHAVPGASLSNGGPGITIRTK